MLVLMNDSLTAFFNHSFMLLALSVLGLSASHNAENFVLFMHGFLTSALIHTALLMWRYLENDLQGTILDNNIIC